ncbi:hypothetical protein SOVF_073300 [Spinacia oleracea]|uniref:23 kDa jasmonate-induced protein n=1 Tax=Spinacia oleracea TaxID=3562 RepID=A0A9R0J4S7_SPIOL|nr:23 kDa jasmonate-induced protein-like [Spinacia oleracea]KNA18083.1 hypothetical protein SOVF_073300 [Spinacia oleracea]
MGSNVFGTPITQEMLKSMPEYHGTKDKDINAHNRAVVALEMKNAEGKDTNARKFLKALEPRFGLDTMTMCTIYNATGDPLTLVDAHSWTGRVCESPYPMMILNGQWGAFLHGKHADGHSSEAVVVYKGNNLHWVLSFSNLRTNVTNKVYTEISESRHYDDQEWKNIKNSLDKGKTTHKSEGNNSETVDRALMFASIGDISICEVEAILTTPKALSDPGYH